MEILKPLVQPLVHALITGNSYQSRVLIEQARACDVSTEQIYLHLLTPCMHEVGTLWEQNYISVAEEHLATAIVESLINQLARYSELLHVHARTVVLASVGEEQHVLALQMLADMFRAAQWRTLYLGANVPLADLIGMLEEFEVQCIAFSVNIDDHVSQTAVAIEQIRRIHAALTVMVGGAAFDRDSTLWRSVGADIYHPDPIQAVALASLEILPHE